MEAREAAIRASSRAAEAAWHAQLEQLRTPPRQSPVPSTLSAVNRVQNAENRVAVNVDAHLQVDEEYKKRYYARLAAFGIVDKTASVAKAPMSQQVHEEVETPDQIEKEQLVLEPVHQPVAEVQPVGVMISNESKSELQLEVEREREHEHVHEPRPKSAEEVVGKAGKTGGVEALEVVTTMAHSTEDAEKKEHMQQVSDVRPNSIEVQPVGVMVSAESEVDHGHELEPMFKDEVVGKADKTDDIEAPVVVTAMAHSTEKAEEELGQQVGVVRPNPIEVQPVDAMASAESESKPQRKVEHGRGYVRDHVRELKPESKAGVAGKADKMDDVEAPEVVTAMTHSTEKADEKEHVEQVGVIRPNLIKALGNVFRRWMASLQGKEGNEGEQKKSGLEKGAPSTTGMFMSAGSGDQ